MNKIIHTEDIDRSTDIDVFLTKYMKKKRTELPLFFHDPKKAFSTFNKNGIPRPHVTLVLRTQGCSWLRDSGGCTMCGFAIDSLYPCDTVNSEDIIAQFDREMKKYNNINYPLTVSIFNNGSFLDSNEIPLPAGRYILDHLAQDDRVKEVRIETRPEFVNSPLLEETALLYEKKELHIAIGLEVCSDRIRSISIHKGFAYNDFLHAAEMLPPYVYLDVYLLLKSPFLTEKEALTEMIASLVQLAEVCPSTVYITPCKVFPTTLLSDLETQGMYSVSWLWSLLEIAKAFTEYSPPYRLFLVNGEPVEEEPVKGVVGAQNCGLCDAKVRDVLNYFNRTQKLPLVLPSCMCRKKWEEELSRIAPPLEERVHTFIGGNPNV